jgi:N-acetylneuraminic acid mutarotase
MNACYSYNIRLIIAFVVALVAVVALACGGGGIASMEEGRGEHAATLLTDGRLLVAGGRDSKALASSEVYDPAIGEWSSAGPLTTARYGHTQTLLKDGKVLAVGGNAPPEVYDPTTGTWSSTGSMTYLRISGHTTTLLEDGRVLVTGGISDVDGSRKMVGFAELYDPSTGTWELTGDMTEPRERHQAVLLNDKTVLVIGSKTDRAYVIGETSAELYNPATGKWSKAGNLPNAHAERFAVTLLGDGRVLIAGGGTRGRTLAPNITASMDIYDPSTGEWSTAIDMPAKSWGHTTTVLPDGTILFVEMVRVEIFDPAAETWTSVGKLTKARNGLHTATLLEDGRVFIVGGDNITYDRVGRISAREGLDSVRVYDPAEEW